MTTTIYLTVLVVCLATFFVIRLEREEEIAIWGDVPHLHPEMLEDTVAGKGGGEAELASHRSTRIVRHVPHSMTGA